MLLNCGVGRRLLRVPWTARRSNLSILKEISLGYSLEGLMWKLKLQYFGHLMWRADSLKKTLMLGKIKGRRRRGRQRMRWLDGITNSMHMSLGKSRSWWWIGRPGILQIHGVTVRHDWATELNWTEVQLGALVYKIEILRQDFILSTKVLPRTSLGARERTVNKYNPVPILLWV